MIIPQWKARTISILLLLLFLLRHTPAHSQDKLVWEAAGRGLQFRWDLARDQASLNRDGKTFPAWTGSLLPAFWLQDSTGKYYIHATVEHAVVEGTGSVIDQERLTLQLNLGGKGHGTLSVEKRPWGIRFANLRIQWEGQPPAIVEMYLGTSIPPAGADNMFTWDRPFLPDWQAAGYCIPGAREGTAQSFFRNWDFGHATIALGNFGPSMGTPYAAAFPRPLLFAAMGNEAGWICFGAGSIPDAPLSLKIQSTRGCFQYLYREDKWGAPPGKKRDWSDLLRISFDSSAYDAFAGYYASFSSPATDSSSPARRSPSPLDSSHPYRPSLASAGIWNTWGMWKQGQFALPPLTDFAARTGAGILVLDGGWESAQGSGRPSSDRFPHFTADIDQAKKKGLSIGLWESLAWLSDTSTPSLSSADLIVDARGRPVKTNWNFDPAGPAYYCLDISSQRARTFLQERTARMMQQWKPRLIKLDFGYALPTPDMGVPREPALRGERYCYALIRLIAEAAKKVDPDVLIMYYGLSPLYLPLVDIVSLDDQGDLWYAIASGHQEWSIWASLAGTQGTGLSGSSTYNWDDDREVLLNSAVLGIPGAVLPIMGEKGQPIPTRLVNRRLALNRWYRKTRLWTPRWYNSYRGGLDRPPQLKCWGREEYIDGKKCLTVLALRQDPADAGASVENIRWSGDWALIARDDNDIIRSGNLAVIPFTKGKLSLPLAKKPARVLQVNTGGSHIFRDWQWVNGRLSISVSESAMDITAGFIVSEK